MNISEELNGVQEGSDDSSDEDFNPAGWKGSGSEEDSGDEIESGGENGAEENGEDIEGMKRRKKDSHRPRKKIRKGKVKGKEEEKENSQEVKELTEEEVKKKTDLLWADFMKDCGAPLPKKRLEGSKEEKSSTPPEAKNHTSQERPETKNIPSQQQNEVREPKTFTFAGEQVRVERKPEGGVQRKSDGLGSLLGKLGKSGKLSTLEKSKLDWESFKQDEGIKEDIESYNRGKSGYLERQDFLLRADHRQFELEKQLRAQQRKTLNR